MKTKLNISESMKAAEIFLNNAEIDIKASLESNKRLANSVNDVRKVILQNASPKFREEILMKLN